MKFQKLNLSFSKYTDSNQLTLSQGISLSLTNNGFFPGIDLAALQNAIPTYSNALNAATDRGRGNIALKNAARKELESVLQQLGLTVMSIANGDVSMLATTGFPMSKTPMPVYITNPGNVVLSNDITSGQLVSAVPTVQGARNYFHQITPDPITDTSNWQSNTSSRSKYTFTDLEAGKKYWVRVAVTGSGSQLAYGPANSTFVQ